MRKAFLAMTAAGLLFVSTAALAQESNPSAEFNRCMDASRGIDPVMDECFDAENERQDTALNTVYRQLMGKLTGPDNADLRQAVVTSERAWIAYRDAECGLEYEKEAGGMMAGQMQRNCTMNMTLKRIDELKSLLKFVNER